MDTDKLGAKALTDSLRTIVGLTSSYTTQLVKGPKKPSLDLAIKIEELTGIPPKLWKREDRAAAMWEHLMAVHSQTKDQSHG